MTPKRILLVDDNPDAVAVLAIALRRAGHEVFEAINGHAAMIMVRACKPDLIFLDLGLPGLDGYEIARLIRMDPTISHTRILALTAQSQQRERDAAMDAGVDQFIVKPIDLSFIDSLLGQR